MIIIIFVVYICMPTTLLFELLIIRNKTNSPVDFEFTRFDCLSLTGDLIQGPHYLSESVEEAEDLT